ncbi:hypothetical protein [Nocardioides zeae]
MAEHRADAVAVLRLVHVAAQLGVVGALVWVWWWHPGSGVASGVRSTRG